MAVRAVVFDVYRTLLSLGGLRSPSAAEWARVWERAAGQAPPLGFEEFTRAWDEAVRQEHERARAAGVEHPEVDAPAVVRAAVPACAGLPRPVIERLLLAVMGALRESRLADGAAGLLRELRERGIPLGIASNSQCYTLPELGAALEQAGLGLDIFEPDLVFWSHTHGFAKPSPFVFRLLGARLAARDIPAGDALMAGDRPDRDTGPASAQGWRTVLVDPADPRAAWRQVRALAGLPGAG